MSLTKRQIMEIARFDWKRRTGLDFDGRRYGSVTGGKAKRLTDAWSPCHGSDVFKGKERPTRKTLRYNYIVARTTNGRSGAPEPQPVDVDVLHVAVRLDRAYRQVVKDVGRWHIRSGRLELRDIDYHGIGGWIVEWQDEDWKCRAAGDGPRIGKPLDDGWCNGGKWKFNTGLTFPWHETVNPKALKGTRYEWCQYGDDTPCKAGLVDWLMMYRAEPKIELLAKAGMYALICPVGLKALKDRRIRDWCMAHREEIARGERYRRHEAADILYAARHGGTIAAARKRREFVTDARRYVGGGPWRIDYDRLRKAIGRWHVGIDEFSRYLEYAHDCGLDLRNEGTLYPPTKGGREVFMARLEKLESRAARVRRARERKEREAEERRIAEVMKTRLPELEAFQRSFERTAELTGCGYTIRLAKSQEELLAEGRRMGNCVGCGTYGRGIVEGDTLIVMLGLGGRSHCDIEIERKTWTVRQCYLKGNKRAPEEMHELARRIAACCKAEWKRMKRRRRAA